MHAWIVMIGNHGSLETLWSIVQPVFHFKTQRVDQYAFKRPNFWYCPDHLFNSLISEFCGACLFSFCLFHFCDKIKPFIFSSMFNQYLYSEILILHNLFLNPLFFNRIFQCLWLIMFDFYFVRPNWFDFLFLYLLKNPIVWISKFQPFVNRSNIFPDIFFGSPCVSWYVEWIDHSFFFIFKTIFSRNKNRIDKFKFI